MARLAASEENTRFVLTTTLIGAGILASLITAIASFGGTGLGAPIILAETVLAILTVGTMFRLARWVPTARARARFMQDLIEDLLGGGNVEAVSEKWRTWNARR